MIRVQLRRRHPSAHGRTGSATDDLAVLYKQVNRESLTAEAMQRLGERADADKLKKAVERLKQL